MGFFSKIFGSGSSSGEVEQIDIVGESFHRESFQQLRQAFNARVGDRVAVQVEFRLETDNPHAVKGKAVAVYVNGLPVGHVSSYQVDEAFKDIELSGGRKVVSGAVSFADMRESVAKNSVVANYRVRKNVAPAPTAEEIQAKKDKDEADRNSLAELKRSGWARVSLKPGDVICFTMFERVFALELEAKAQSLGVETKNNVVKALSLLVIEESSLDDSSKIKQAFKFKIPVTNLKTFLEVNPGFTPKSLGGK